MTTNPWRHRGITLLVVALGILIGTSVTAKAQWWNCWIGNGDCTDQTACNKNCGGSFSSYDFRCANACSGLGQGEASCYCFVLWCTDLTYCDGNTYPTTFCCYTDGYNMNKDRCSDLVSGVCPADGGGMCRLCAQ